MIKIISWVMAAAVAVTGASASPAPARSGQPVSIRPVIVNHAILGIGDSITYGFQSPDGAGYRKHLDAQVRGWATPWGHTWVGPFTDPTGRRHDGRGGWTIDQLATVARADTAAANPGVVLVMAGTNDARADDTATNMISDMTRLLAEVKAAAPGAFVIVAKIPKLPSGTATQQATVAAYNAALPALVVKAAAGGQWIALADASGVENGPDGIHLTDLGNAQFAAAWLKVLRPVVAS